MKQQYFNSTVTSMNHGFPIENSSATSSPTGSTSSYASMTAPPPAWLFNSANRDTSSASSSSSGEDGLSMFERASKRQRIASPPRPSMCADRFFLSARSSSFLNDITDDSEDCPMPPSIQRLALPSLLHSCDLNLRHHSASSANASDSLRQRHHHLRNYSSDACPFGTMM